MITLLIAALLTVIALTVVGVWAALFVLAVALLPGALRSLSADAQLFGQRFQEVFGADPQGSPEVRKAKVLNRLANERGLPREDVRPIVDWLDNPDDGIDVLVDKVADAYRNQTGGLSASVTAQRPD